MNPIEMLSFAKFASNVFSNNVTMSEVEAEIVAEILKKAAEQSPYWTPNQKELYKFMVEVIKEQKG